MSTKPKGLPKTGGRVRGTPNKRKLCLLDELEQILTEDGQPVSVIKLFFQSLMDMPSFQRVDALLKFMEFVYPKRKQTEHSFGEQEFKAVLVERIMLLNSKDD